MLAEDGLGNDRGKELPRTRNLVALWLKCICLQGVRILLAHLICRLRGFPFVVTAVPNRQLHIPSVHSDYHLRVPKELAFLSWSTMRKRQNRALESDSKRPTALVSC